MTRALSHRRLIQGVANLYAQLCDIQSPSVTRDTDGSELVTWATVERKVPCQQSAMTSANSGVRGSTWRAFNKQYVEDQLAVVLRGYFPNIEENYRVLMDDGQVLRVDLISHDSQRRYTRLTCSEVR